MKVKDLIERLSWYSPEYSVVVNGESIGLVRLDKKYPYEQVELVIGDFP